MLQATSSPEREAGLSEASWRRFVWLFICIFWGGLIGLFMLMLLLDPYDSGRAPFSMISGIADDDSRFAHASHGRDPRYDAAVIGNSRGALLNPARLTKLTGRRFVQLTVPGTGPREQLTMLRWFVRHHAKIGAIVLVTDERWWCDPESSLPTYPFPSWLYGGRLLDYLPMLLSAQSVDRIFQRIGIAFGVRKRSDPSGFVDYEAGAIWSFNPVISPMNRDSREPDALVQSEPEEVFHAIDKFSAATSTLIPSTAPVILVMPPAFYTSLPQPGSAAAAHVAQCKRALARLAASRSRGSFLDFFIDSDNAHDPKNFMDATHYRSNIAQIIEERIAETLARTGNPNPADKPF